MKLILLPGMDGTGELFEDFLSNLNDIDHSIISFPQSGDQDYDSLLTHVKSRLPNEDFVVLAESFAGPIAAKLAFEKMANLRGIIFVASFLSAPNRLTLSLAHALPIKVLLKLPFSEFGVRKLMLGVGASTALIIKFQNTVASVPSKILRARIQAMKNLIVSSSTSRIPVFYVSGSKDRLVHPSKMSEFRQCFPVFEHRQLQGPHFLLQANPKASSDLVREIRSLVTDQLSSQPSVAGIPQSAASHEVS